MRRDTLRRVLDEAAQAKEADRARQRDYDLRVLERAAVDAGKLTSSDHWNAYLEQVAALNQRDEKQLLLLESQANELHFRSAEECQRIAFDRAVLRARVQGRHECIDIPKRIQGAARQGPE